MQLLYKNVNMIYRNTPSKYIIWNKYYVYFTNFHKLELYLLFFYTATKSENAMSCLLLLMDT